MKFDKEYYKIAHLNGKPLLFWAIKWLRMSNNTFYSMYGFNFNPHEYPNLYKIARKEVYGQ